MEKITRSMLSVMMKIKKNWCLSPLNKFTSVFFADSVDFCVLGDVNCVRWNPFEKSNQRTFLTCSDDRTIRLWKYIE